MQRFFNVAGPCNPGEHYMLPAQQRCGDLMKMIDRRLFFVIHAARQSGKTTLLRNLADELNSDGRYYALYCSLESVQSFPNPAEGMPAIVRSLRGSVARHPGMGGRVFAAKRNMDDINTVIFESFTDLCEELDRPLVMLFDEADCLSEGTLITFLRQLREGYINREWTPFIHSLALVGMRNIRDFKAQVRPDSHTLGSSSPFNIVTESLTLPNFTRNEIAMLYGQRTADTGQPFAGEAIDLVFHYTQGQPWLVNAVARETIEDILENNVAVTVEESHAREAVERIIQRRDTHIDSLLERLKESRVRSVIEPVLNGESGIKRQSDDYEYTRDLGLIREDRGVVMPANPIYAEVIARALTSDAQLDLPVNLINRWVDDTEVHVSELLREFQRFWRTNCQRWRMKIEYHEVYAELVLQAFLQRVLNGGAWIARQFASGSGRVDLCVEYKDRRYPIEIKVKRQWSGNLREEGLEQLGEYMDALGQAEGWLVVFEQREDLSWDERITWEDVETGGKTIHVAGV